MITITTLQPKKKILFEARLLKKLKIQKDNYRTFKKFGYTLFLSLLLLVISKESRAQAISATYNFASVTTSSGLTDPTTPPTATGATFSAFTAVGQTVANPNATGRFSFTGHALATTPTSTGNATCVCDGAILTTRYYEVTVTVAAGFNVDLSSITFTLQRSGTGIRQYAVRADADSYAANLAASISPANANLSVVATNVFQVTDAVTSLQDGSTITLSGASFTALGAGSTRTFRFYGWNAEASGGTFSIDNVVINGIATPAAGASMSATALSPAGSFSTNEGTASAIKTFTLVGTNLTTPLTVAALSGYEYSDDGFATAGVASLSYNTASVSKTISVRLAASTLAGTYNGNIVVASTGAAGSPTNVAATGTVISLTPAITVGALTPGTTFYTTLGSPSPSQTFSLNATNLSASLQVGPLAGYQFSDNFFTTPLDSIVYAAAPSISKTISVRLTGASLGTFNGNIDIASAGATGSPDTIAVTGQVNPVPSMTQVIFPQFAINGSTAGSRLQYVCRLGFSNLTPNATYRYITGASAGATFAGNMFVINNTTGTFGYITGQTSSKSLNGTLMSGDSTHATSKYGEFTADGSGNYEGWFSMVPTGNAIFGAGNNVAFRIQLNDGAGGGTAISTLNSTDSITMLLPAAGTNGAQALRGVSSAANENMIFLYDNTAGTGRPIYGTWAENDGIPSGFTTWYGTVEGTSGSYGAYIPVALASGLQRVEQRVVATGAIVGCPATDGDGLWPSGTNTVNPAGGTTALVLDATDNAFFFTPSVSISASPGTTNCAAANVTFTATPVNGGTTPSYQWKLNGVNVGADNPVYANNTLADNDSVTCIMTSSLSCPSPASDTSNHIILTVIAPSTPTVSLSVSPGANVCSGTSVTVTADTTYGGANPNFEFFLNGVSVQNGTSNTYTTTISASDTITCELTSDASCITTTTANSDTIFMQTTLSVTPSVSIVSDAQGDTLCPGTNVTFTATGLFGGVSPSYQWKLNGVNDGANSATYSTNALVNNDTVTCVFTSNDACATPTTATSNKIGVTVLPTVIPSVSIVSDDANDTICAGTNVTFTATPVNGGMSPFYQWKLNGGNVGTNSATYSINSLASGDEVSCVMTSNDACPVPATATSDTIKTTVFALPTLSVAPASITILSYTSTLIVASGNSVSYLWSPGGETNDSITVSPAGTTTYYVTGTSSNGCSKTDSSVVTVTPPYVAGNIVVDRIGDGSIVLGSGAHPVFIDEYNSSAANQLTPVSSGAFPSVVSRPAVAPFNLMETGTATSDGYISRSNDGSIIVVPGYNGIPGDANIASSNSATIGRTVGIVAANTTFTTPTSINMMSGQNFRSAASDGVQIWGAASGGISYIANSMAATATSIWAGNTRTLTAQYGQLYAISASTTFNGTGSTFGIWKMGNGLPTTSLGTAPSPNVTQEISTGAGSSPYAFSFNATRDVCFISDDRAYTNSTSTGTGGIQKWTKSGSVWSLAYVIRPDTATTTGVRGMVVDYGGADPVIYATTTQTSNNKLIKVTDTGASSISIILSTAGTNKVFRGVSFTPVKGGLLTVNSVGFTNDFGVVSLGYSSDSASFTVTGSSLTNPLTITPPVGYEIRTAAGSWTTSPIIITPSAGSIPATVIYVRFTPLATGVQSGTINLVSTGAIDQQLFVTGIGQIYYPPRKLAVTVINPASPQKNFAFSVTVRSQDSLSQNQNVSVNTPVKLLITIGTGTLAGIATGTILAGTSTVTVSGLSYNIAEDSVQITAETVGLTLPDSLTPGDKYFNVLDDANQLAFAFLPTTAITNAFFPYNNGVFNVRALRPNNTIDANYSSAKTITITYTGPGTMSGFFTSNPTNGSGSFSNFTFDTPGAYVITATSDTLPPITATINVIDQPAVSDVIFPKYAVNGSNSGVRLPFVCRLQLNGLETNATYRYFTSGSNGIGAPQAGNMFAINNSPNDFGYITGYTSGKSVSGAKLDSNLFSSANSYAEFTTDAGGSYEGWFSVVPTGNAIFNPGKFMLLGITINDGNGGTFPITSLLSNNFAVMLNPANVHPDTAARAIRGTSYATPENMVFLYDQTDGNTTDRPIWGTWAEGDGIYTSFTSWYNPAVDSGSAGSWGAYIPSNLPGGVQRIEQRSVATAAIIGCPAIDLDGIWPSGDTTVNRAGGTNPIVIKIQDAGLAETYTITANPSANGSITTGGIFNCGDSAVFQIFADICYQVADVLVDGVSVGSGASYTFYNLSANHTITATFGSILAVDSLNPLSGTVGSSITIFGYGFTGATDVQFNGVTVGAGNFTVINDTQITATVPAAATSGTVSVFNNTCVATSDSSFAVISTAVTLNLKLFIQGYYDNVSGLMRTPLYSSQQAVLPDPFPGVTFGPNDCDSIRIELREAASPATVAASAMALMLDSGAASATFPGSINGGNYYIAIFHQNSVQTWSADSITFGAVNNYDFTDNQNKAFGGNMIDVGGVWAFYSGDMDQNENIDLSDFPLWDDDATLFVFGYYVSDLNGDTNVDLSDFPFWDDNATNFIFSAHP